MPLTTEEQARIDALTPAEKARLDALWSERIAKDPRWADIRAGRKPTPGNRTVKAGEPQTRPVREIRANRPQGTLAQKFQTVGPGAVLRVLLESVGLHPAEGCGCEGMAAQMDAWGITGCREHRAEIIAYLEDQRAKTKWTLKVKAGVLATRHGWMRLNPLDVCGSLVDEAIRRAEQLADPPAGQVVKIDAARLVDGTAFNCSMIRYNGKLLFAYRTGWAGAEIHVCELTDKLQPAAPSITLNRLYHRQANYGREDPRLFVYRDRLHVAYIGVAVRDRKLYTSQLYARLTDDLIVEETFYPEYADRAPWEKNWSFFEHDGELYAVHSIRPHVVLKIDGNRAEKIAETPNTLPWSGGYLRGGAPPVRVGDEFYHFFHGKRDAGDGRPVIRYSVGACVFEARPPFRVIRQTAEPIEWADSTTRPADQYCDCIFPGGAVRDGDVWRVACGIHDRWAEIHTYGAAHVEAALSLARPYWWSDRPDTIDQAIFRDVVERDDYRLGRGPIAGAVLDVGAHVGCFTFAAWSRGAIVHAYEPDPASRSHLLSNVAHMPGVLVFTDAIGHPDSPPLYLHTVPGAHNTGGSAVIASSETTWPGEVTALIDGPVPLDAAIERAAADSPTGRVAVLKLDCEGCEWPALTGAKRLDLVDRIVGEWHVNDRFAWAGKVWGPDDLAGLLEPHGFRVTVPDSPTAPTHGLFWADPSSDR